jgi:hypothetical protein
MIIITNIKWGFGNKILMFLYAVYTLKKNKYDKLYIVQQDSHHDSGILEESFLYIFPNLKNIKWLEFISWKEYDNIKKQAKDKIILDMDTNYWFTNKYILALKKFIKKYMILNKIYTIDNYDINNGIALHIRYGDKLIMNKQRIDKGLKPEYIILKPEYYFDNIKKLNPNNDTPIYIFTDSPDIVSKTILPRLTNAKICPEHYSKVFFLLTKIKKQIISESTLSICAGYFAQIFSDDKFEIIAPDYNINVNTLLIQPNIFHNDGYFIEENNKKYIGIT